MAKARLIELNKMLSIVETAFHPVQGNSAYAIVEHLFKKNFVETDSVKCFGQVEETSKSEFFILKSGRIIFEQFNHCQTGWMAFPGTELETRKYVVFINKILERLKNFEKEGHIEIGL